MTMGIDACASNLIFLWGVPRSLSTAFEKMIACSHQFQVVGEPFIDTYKSGLLSAQKWQDAKLEFEQKFDDLVGIGQRQAVFVKDMAYHAEPFLSDHHILSATHTFLIRDPHLSIPSLYRMRPDFTEDQPGFEGQYRLFERVAQLTGRAPFVMDGEMLKTRANVIVSEYFRHIGFPLPQDVLTWPKGARDDWKNRASWHVDAINSEGFEAIARNVDLKTLPGRVLHSIERNMHFYEKMKRYV